MSCRPPAASPAGTRQDRAFGPLEGSCEFGDPRSPSPRAYVTDTSPRPEHLAWNPPPPGSHGRDAAPAGAGWRARSSGAELCRASPPREITKAKAVRVRGVLGRHPSPVSPADAAGPAGYHFPRRPTHSQAPGALREGEYPAASASPVCRSRASASLTAGRRRWWQQTPTLSRAAGEAGEFSSKQRHTKSPRASAVSPRVAEPRCPLAAALAQSGEHFHI